MHKKQHWLPYALTEDNINDYPYFTTSRRTSLRPTNRMGTDDGSMKKDRLVANSGCYLGDTFSSVYFTGHLRGYYVLTE